MNTTVGREGARLTALEAARELGRWFDGDYTPTARSDFDAYQESIQPIIERMKAQQDEQNESDLQLKCVKALREMGLVVSASANGIKCSGRQMLQMKNRGLVPGWPDLTVIDRHGAHVYIELKTRKGLLSKDQIDVHALLNKRKCQVYVCRSVDEVVRLFA